MAALRGPVEATEGGEVLLRVKAVPGASRDEVVGLHGDRVKVRVASPPEGGRANAALLGVLARALGVSPRALTLVAGPSSPTKTVRVRGLPADAVARRLGLDPPAP